MKMHLIEIDDIIMKYLQRHAEPLIDTTNSVLHKLLPQAKVEASLDSSAMRTLANSNETRIESPYDTPYSEYAIRSELPKALTQILEVIYEIKKNGINRREATKVVAKRRGTTFQTIIDKYCRQLDLKAAEVDRMLEQDDLSEFKLLLIRKFENHTDLINSFFQSIQTESGGSVKTKKVEMEINMQAGITKREYGALCRDKLAKHLENSWGSYELTDSLFKFSNGQKILSLYASLSNDRWWYGVSKQYWESWDDRTHMAFLMREGSKCNYVILSPKDSIVLLDMIQPAQDGQKKINVRIPSGSGKIYIQEWQEFPFEQKAMSLGEITS